MLASTLSFIMRIQLKEWRENRGLALRKLAEVSGVHFVSIAKIEAGGLDPKLSTLMKLCKALRISPNQLLGVAKQPRKGR